MEGQLQHSFPVCLNCLFHFRGKKLSQRQIEKVKRLWVPKEADEDEDVYFSLTGKHSKFRRIQEAGFILPLKRKIRTLLVWKGIQKLLVFPPMRMEKKAGMTTIESMSKLRWNLNIPGVIKINQRLKVRTRLGGKILHLHQKMKQ